MASRLSPKNESLNLVQYSDVIRISPQAMVLVRLQDGFIVDMNEAFSNLSGHARKEAIGQTPSCLKIWDNYQEREQFIKRIESYGKISNLETILCNKKENFFHTLVSAQKVQIEGEWFYLATIHDITEYRRGEAARALNGQIANMVITEQPLNRIMQEACDLLVKHYRFAFCGVRWKESDGFIRFGAVAGKLATKATLENPRNIYSLHTNPDRKWPLIDVILSGKMKIIKGSDIKDKEVLEVAKKYNLNSMVIFPIIVRGEVEGALQIISENKTEFDSDILVLQLENIANQMAIATAMTKERQRVNMLVAGLEATACSVFFMDTERHIRWVNTAFQHSTGYSKEEIIGKVASVLRSDKTETGFYEKAWSNVLEGISWRGEHLNRCKDGSEFLCEDSLSPIFDEQGKVYNVVSVRQDITNRKKAEQSLLEAKEIRLKAEKVATIGAMAAGISHEINQPLNSIKLISSGLVFTYLQGKPRELQEYIEGLTKISGQADRINNIISHLRSFIRQDKSKMERCSLNLAVEQSLGVIGRKMSSHDIAVDVALQASLPHIWAVPTGLEEVIINLLVNAMQALDTMDKSDKTIWVSTIVIDEKVKIEIVDNGPGIKEELIKTIFEPFVSTRSERENLGLGLSIVRAIISSFDGTVEVFSDGRSGTRFQIQFPIARENKEDE